MIITEKKITVGLDISSNATGLTIKVGDECYKFLIANGMKKVFPDMVCIDYNRIMEHGSTSQTLLKIVSGKLQAKKIIRIVKDVLYRHAPNTSLSCVDWRYEELSMAKLGSNSRLADMAIFSTDVISEILENGVPFTQIHPIIGTSLKKAFLGSTMIPIPNSDKKRKADKDDMVARYIEEVSPNFTVEKGMKVDDVVDSWVLAHMILPKPIVRRKKKKKKKTS